MAKSYDYRNDRITLLDLTHPEATYASAWPRIQAKLDELAADDWDIVTIIHEGDYIIVSRKKV